MVSKMLLDKALRVEPHEIGDGIDAASLIGEHSEETATVALGEGGLREVLDLRQDIERARRAGQRSQADRGILVGHLGRSDAPSVLSTDSRSPSGSACRARTVAFSDAGRGRKRVVEGCWEQGGIQFIGPNSRWLAANRTASQGMKDIIHGPFESVTNWVMLKTPN